jgi:hypothetical protein
MSCVLLFVLAVLAGHASGGLLFVDHAVAPPLYQWSHAGAFPNGTFLLFANATEYASSGLSTGCVFLAHQRDWVAARAALAQLLPDTACAVVQADAAPSALNQWTVPNSILDTPFPVGLVFGPLDAFVPPGGVAPVQFLGWDHNYYLDSYWVRIAFFIVLFLFNFACAGWGAYNLSLRRNLAPRVNVATVCIFLETLSAVFRVLDDIITLVYFTEPWADVNRHLDSMFVYMSGSCSLSSGIFVIFFWIDMTSGSLYHGCFLDRALGPCVFFVAAVFALIYVSAVLQVFYPAIVVVLYVQLALLIFLVLVACIYFVAAFRLARYINANQEFYSTEKRKGLMRVTYKVVASGAISIFTALCSLGYLLSTTIAGSIACDFLTAFGTVFRSMLVISIFGTPKKEKSGTSGPTSKASSGSAPKMAENHCET